MKLIITIEHNVIHSNFEETKKLSKLDKAVVTCGLIYPTGFGTAVPISMFAEQLLKFIGGIK